MSAYKNKLRCLRCAPLAHFEGGPLRPALVMRKNRKTGKKFLGCSMFPNCRYTEEWEEVSYKKEEKALSKFIIGKWYVIQKPANIQAKNAGGVACWESSMDKYDLWAARCDSTCSNGKLGIFEGVHSFAFHIDWTDGPYDSYQGGMKACSWKKHARSCRELKLKSQGGDLETARSKTVTEGQPLAYMVDLTPTEGEEISLMEQLEELIGKPETVERKTSEDAAKKEIKVIQKKFVDKFAALDGTNDLFLDSSSDKFSHLKAVKKKSKPKKEILTKVRSRWSRKAVTVDLRTPKGNTIVVDDRVTAHARLGVVGSTEDTIDQKFQKDVDGIFNDYRNRNAQRITLQARLDEEFSKPTKAYRLRAFLGKCSLVAVVPALVAGALYAGYVGWHMPEIQAYFGF
jgi:hypothetical protein